MNNRGLIAILVAICLLAVTAVIIPTHTDHSLSANVTMTGDLPVIEVRGDDRSDRLLDADVDSIEKYHQWIMDNITNGKKLPAMALNACSAFSVTTDNERFVGRNLEFTFMAYTPMIVKNTPYNGYKSIGMTPWFSVFDANETFEDAKNDIRARAAPLMTMDGMNEKGLSCSLLVMGNENVSQDRSGALCTFALLRYFLDHVATVDEAINVVNRNGYSNGFVVGELIKTKLHVFVSDAQGNTLVIESINNKLCLTTGKDANVVTNHCLSKECTNPPSENSLMRYNKLKAEVSSIESHPEKECTLDHCRDMLKSVSRKWNPEGPFVQSITRWSEVFDINNLTMYVWLYAEYDKTPYVFSIHDMS